MLWTAKRSLASRWPRSPKWITYFFPVPNTIALVDNIPTDVPELAETYFHWEFMTHTGQFLFLGTGASGGVPVVGCSCDICQSTHPRNKRLRSSGILTIDSHSLLIDPGPDFRQQALAHHVMSLDSVFVTHTHYDHIGGMEELRVFTLKNEKSLSCFLSPESMESVKKMFYYHFEKKAVHANHKAEFDFKLLEGDTGSFSIGEALLQYVRYRQGGMEVLGLRLGDFAYISDLKTYDEALLNQLKGVKVLVTSALRFGRSRLQMNVDEAVAFISAVGAEQGYLTHMSHDIDYEEVISRLPSNIKPAYDGLILDFSW